MTFTNYEQIKTWARDHGRRIVLVKESIQVVAYDTSANLYAIDAEARFLDSVAGRKTIRDTHMSPNWEATDIKCWPIGLQAFLRSAAHGSRTLRNEILTALLRRDPLLADRAAKVHDYLVILRHADFPFVRTYRISGARAKEDAWCKAVERFAKELRVVDGDKWRLVNIVTLPKGTPIQTTADL